MRNCPHCGKEIKDEAIFCRYCRREVTPPVWMSRLQKCTFCAEWIEPGLDHCPICRNTLKTPEEGEAPRPKEEEPDSFIANLRRQAERLDLHTHKPPSSESKTPEAEITPPPTDPPKPAPRFTPAIPPSNGLSGLRSRRLDRAVEMRPLDDMLSSELPAKEKGIDRPRVTTSLLRALLVMLCVAVVGVVAIALITGPGKSLFQKVVTELPSQTPGLAKAETPFAAVTLPGKPSPEVTLASSPSPTTSGEQTCLSWDQVSLSDAGRELCVYGVVRRWFSVEDVPFVAIFSEEEGTFAFVDRNAKHTEVRSGMCMMATGQIEVMRATRPFIDVEASGMHLCTDDLRGSP
jgi:hypothetical protein